MRGESNERSTIGSHGLRYMHTLTTTSYTRRNKKTQPLPSQSPMPQQHHTNTNTHTSLRTDGRALNFTTAQINRGEPKATQCHTLVCRMQMYNSVVYTAPRVYVNYNCCFVVRELNACSHHNRASVGYTILTVAATPTATAGINKTLFTTIAHARARGRSRLVQGVAPKPPARTSLWNY